MKVLFLDIDGVLNSTQALLWHKRVKGIKGTVWMDQRYFCPISINNLVYILNKSQHLSIVISSTWRLRRSLDEIRSYLEPYGVKPSRIIDKTPVLHTRRGFEIQAWLDEHSDVTDFVILDDGNDMEHLTPKLVLTDESHGLMLKDAIKALTILGHKSPNP